MLDIMGPFLVGSLLSIIGFLTTVTKHFVLEFGRLGFFNPKPLFRVQLTGARARRFGMVCLGIGVAITGLCLYLDSSQDNINQNQGILTVITILASVLAIFTFLVELFFEYLVWLRNRAKNKTS